MKKFPNAFTIMLLVILLAWGLTFLIPSGSYQRITDPETERTTVVPGSFEYQETAPLDLLDLFVAIPQGIIDRADVIVLILLIGGCFYLIEKTGVLGQSLEALVRRLKGRESLAIVLLSLLFATAGATIGLQEEIIALTPILLLFGKSMGYRIPLTIAMSFGTAIIAAAFSPLNPFAVLIAQKEADLPLLSAVGFRTVAFFAVLTLWIVYLLYRARKYPAEKMAMTSSSEALGGRGYAILGLTAGVFVWVTVGILKWDWGFNELSGCFFALGITSGFIAGMSLNRIGTVFIDGFREMIFAGIIVGLAGAITRILQDAVVIDTLVQGLFYPVESLPKSLSVVGMLFGQAILHLPVPSYSGQAVLTMPILSPLSDLVGIPRQITVLAYQYGAVLMDMITPTNGALMAILAVSGLNYKDWLRFLWKPFVGLMLLAAAVVLIGLFSGVN